MTRNHFEFPSKILRASLSAEYEAAMKAERAKWEAEVEELKREAVNANKKPSAKHTAQQQVSEAHL